MRWEEEDELLPPPAFCSARIRGAQARWVVSLSEAAGSQADLMLTGTPRNSASPGRHAARSMPGKISTDFSLIAAMPRHSPFLEAEAHGFKAVCLFLLRDHRTLIRSLEDHQLFIFLFTSFCLAPYKKKLSHPIFMVFGSVYVSV